jgi:hypothetical protein
MKAESRLAAKINDVVRSFVCMVDPPESVTSGQLWRDYLGSSISLSIPRIKIGTALLGFSRLVGIALTAYR